MKIYVAGKYSANNVLDVLENIHIGIKFCANLLKDGHEPFCPWLDHQYHFYNKDLKVEDYYRVSMAWLEVSELVMVLPNWENSKGVQTEIARAQELKIPIIYITQDKL